jgi:hypothetical protein
MVGTLKRIAMTTLRWTAAWALVGLLLGVGLMLAKVELIAESGAKPGNMSAFSFWVLLCWGVGSIFGLLIGFVFACLMAVGQKLEIGGASGAADWGVRLVCGAIAGALVLWWSWLATRTGASLVSREGVGAGAALGFVSAIVSGFATRIGKRRERLGTEAAS